MRQNHQKWARNPTGRGVPAPAYFNGQTSTKQHATITFTKVKFCFQSNLTLTAAFQTSSTPEIYRPEDPNSRRRSNDVTRIHSVG